MKRSIYQSLFVRYKIISKSSAAKTVFFIIGMIFLTYAFVAKTDEQKLNIKTSPETIRSVSVIDGMYKIDTNIIWSDRNKYELIALLNKEKLIEKNNKYGMPYFIKNFLDSISFERKFNMANPGEKWWTGDIKDLIFTRLRENQKDTTTILSCDKQGLPDKQFAYFAIGKSIAILSYYSGGISLNQNTILIEFKNEIILDFWFTNNQPLFLTKKDLFLSLQRNGNC